jgi:2-oxoisovalerate dehydrogenase E1 component beta subunit
MATMNLVQAINSALDVMLGRNPDVLIFGEDVAILAAFSARRTG